MPHTDSYDVMNDLNALEQAEAIKKDPARQERIKRFVAQQQERVDKALPKTKPRGFNQSVSGSKMERR